MTVKDAINTRESSFSLGERLTPMSTLSLPLNGGSEEIKSFRCRCEREDCCSPHFYTINQIRGKFTALLSRPPPICIYKCKISCNHLWLLHLLCFITMSLHINNKKFELRQWSARVTHQDQPRWKLLPMTPSAHLCTSSESAPWLVEKYSQSHFVVTTRYS